MPRPGDLFPGLRAGAQFGAVPAVLASRTLAQLVSRSAAKAAALAVKKAGTSPMTVAMTSASLVPLAMPKQNTRYGGCGCRPTAEPGPWCPLRQARYAGKAAAVMYGAAMRGEPKASRRILAMRRGIQLRDPRAAAAAQRLDDADKAKQLVTRAVNGDPAAKRQIERIASQAEDFPEAAEAAAMLEVFLTDSACLRDAEELMSYQADTHPDDWIVDEFSEAGLATSLIDAQLYNWPV